MPKLDNPAPPVAGLHLSTKAVIGYGLGDFANNLAFSLSTSFLLYYYTDVAGLSAAAVGRCSSSSGCGTPSPT
jgi:hypothetical protein